jgi:hypothetical protein
MIDAMLEQHVTLEQHVDSVNVVINALLETHQRCPAAADGRRRVPILMRMTADIQQPLTREVARSLFDGSLVFNFAHT